MDIVANAKSVKEMYVDDVFGPNFNSLSAQPVPQSMSRHIAGVKFVCFQKHCYIFLDG